METGEFGLFMEPVFKRTNRSALLLLPKEIYCNWGRCVMRGKSPRTSFEPELFLIPCFEDAEELELFLRQFYDLFFQHELRKWDVDSSFWPINRSWEMFKAWFDIRVTDQVADTILLQG
jgi:hypothetical protein